MDMNVVSGDAVPVEWAQFEGLTLGQMVEAFNAGQTLLGREPGAVKKFSSRADGLRRLETCRVALVKMHGAAGLRPDMQWDVRLVAAAEPPKASRAKLDVAKKITVLAAENPKRAGSRSFAVFALYRTGMTVAEFIAAMEAAGYGRKLAVLEMTWNTSHGFIATE